MSGPTTNGHGYSAGPKLFTGTVHIIQATQDVWDEIQRRHPDTPPVVITYGGRGRGKLVHGHFSTNAWVRGKESLHELFVGGEGLLRGPEGVLGTLLHEAAHGIATTRGIQDCSGRGGVYHNLRFKALGEELGLVITADGNRGFSATEVPDTTADAWVDQIAQLAEVLTIHRLVSGRGATPTKSRNNLVLECACPRKLRASKAVAEVGGVWCDICGEYFVADFGSEEN